jgi:hypothetical protein
MLEIPFVTPAATSTQRAAAILVRGAAEFTIDPPNRQMDVAFLIGQHLPRASDYVLYLGAVILGFVVGWNICASDVVKVDVTVDPSP